MSLSVNGTCISSEVAHHSPCRMLLCTIAQDERRHSLDDVGEVFWLKQAGGVFEKMIY
jgi:hypothetical protein